MAEYKRPAEGFRFAFGGVKTNSSPDSLPSNKYSYAQNVRALNDSSVRTRPGSTSLFATGGAAITDIRSYSALGTDNLPRFLARDSADRIYLDDGTLKATLAGAPHPLGAAMIPFRPNQSPVPYIYIANGSDYQKVSAPDSGNAVSVKKVGIAEPQSPPDACPDEFAIHALGGAAGNYTQSGTAGVPADQTRSTDTMVALFADPASVSPSVSTRYSVQVGTAVQYQRGAMAFMTQASGGSAVVAIQDVLPPINTQTALQILDIFYFAGATGRCIIVPTQMPISASVPQFDGTDPTGNPLNSLSLIAAVRRGSLIQLNPGGGSQETVFVLSVTQGPGGLIAVECSTVNNHVAAETMKGIPAIVVSTNVAPAEFTGQTIQTTSIQSVVNAGTGQLDQPILAANNPFVLRSPIPGSHLPTAQAGDYVHISWNISDITRITELRLYFDVNNGAADFAANAYYISIRPSDLAGAVAGTQTQLAAAQLAAQRQAIDNRFGGDNAPDTIPTINPTGSNIPEITSNSGLPISSSDQTVPGTSQWTEIMLPIRAFQRIGNDQTRSLANAQAARVQVICTNTVTVQFSSIWVGSGNQPDVGDAGALYFYRIRPRDSRTGVVGNPSPSIRYGVAPRRQQVIVTPSSAAYDSQIDTWDIERYGGTVLSWRYVGSIGSASGSFADNSFDDEARSGDLLRFDNFEPWPSIDLPQTLIATKITGNVATVIIPSPTNALRWLPGTRVQVNGSVVYTLFARPTLIGGTSYLFQFIENAGVLTNATLTIQEPTLGNQKLPYMWGPDAAGTLFGVGDPLRPGTLSFCKNNNPDSCPDTYNIEITAPSEPLLGGEVVDGLSYVASPERWWALFANAANPAQRYNIIQQPIPRGLAAPYAHCTDGQSIYFVAKDGIWSSNKGSLTDEDLYNLFPHEGVPGRVYTYGAYTIQPPDYSRAGAFRLAYCNWYLFFTYQDSGGVYRRLILDTRRNAWCVDTSNVPVSVYYHPEQQAGSLLSSGSLYAELLIGRSDGTVHKETDLSNDGNDVIGCVLAPMEWNGGDARAGMQWGDMILDCFPSASGVALSATPVVLGIQAAPPSTFAPSPSRIQEIVSLGGTLTTNYLGLLLAWTDDFTKQLDATRLEIWQPSLIAKPETIGDRITDWYEPAGGAAAFIQGFKMRADTANQVKAVEVRDADSLALHPFTPAVQHNGEQRKAYSFNVPFVAHMVRLESVDTIPWRLWEGEVEWIAQPTPELAETWTTQPTSHGQVGYMHVARIMAAWASTATVTVTITSYDGQSPQAITLPSTGGAFQKQLFILTPNKGVLYTYSAVSAQPFQLFLEDWEIHVGSWRRESGYMIYRNLGGSKGDAAAI